MEKTPEIKELQLIYVIVNRGTGSRVLQIAKKNGLSGGTVLYGGGTIKNHILEALALADVRKEIVYLLADKLKSLEFLEILNKELKLYKPNHGIAYTVDVNFCCGSSRLIGREPNYVGGEQKAMYKSVHVIVDKGKGEDVVDAATKAGAKGATIINARGSGIHETSKLFKMDIEPEKEIVLIILKSELIEQVVASIRQELEIDQPGNGIIFVQNVGQVYGLYE